MDTMWPQCQIQSVMSIMNKHVRVLFIVTDYYYYYCVVFVLNCSWVLSQRTESRETSNCWAPTFTDDVLLQWTTPNITLLQVLQAHVVVLQVLAAVVVLFNLFSLLKLKIQLHQININMKPHLNHGRHTKLESDCDQHLIICLEKICFQPFYWVLFLVVLGLNSLARLLIRMFNGRYLFDSNIYLYEFFF